MSKQQAFRERVVRFFEMRESLGKFKVGNTRDGNVLMNTVPRILASRNVERKTDVKVTHAPNDQKSSCPPAKAQSVVASTSSRKSSKTLIKLQLQKLEEERKLEHDYIDKKYTLLEGIANASSSCSGVSMNRVREWVDDNTHNVEKCVHSGNFEPQRHSTQNQSLASSNSVVSNSSIPEVNDGLRAMAVNCTEQPNNQQSTRNLCPEEYVECPITKKQLAARQAIPRDLPSFSGNPEDWPIFLSSFTNTTVMCGYTDAENAIRLQKCLTGKAYEAVKSRLMYPSNVKGVIDTLRMRFGQPEAIVHSLIAKINALPGLKEDKLETIMDFAVNVQNYCSIVDACGLEDHLYNVSLLHQLVNRLPPSIKLDWARYRQKLVSVNLACFGNWIYSLAEAASAITVPAIQESKSTRSDFHQPKKSGGFLNAHLESESPPHDLQTQTYHKSYIQDCVVCGADCKGVENCKQFMGLPRDSRWAVVREFGLCRRCLRKHNGSCRAKVCGKDGCTFKHHELLHNEQQHKEVSRPDDPRPGTSYSHHECNAHRASSNAVLFRYLPVTIHGTKGSIQTFAFLDEGSALTLLDHDLMEELGLDGTESPLCLRWTGGTERYEKDSRITHVSIAGTQDGAKRFKLNEVRTVKELQLPYQSLNTDEMRIKYPHLRGLPIRSYNDARPRILIGLKHAHVSLVLQSREGNPDQPIAIKTRLGWTVCGGNGENNASNLVHYSFHVHSEEHSDEFLHNAMKEYFALDSLGVVRPSRALLSSEDQRACSMLESLTKYTGDNFETGLLWRYDDIRLPDSRPMALRRYRLLEKRMQKDPELLKVMNQKIVDYLQKGYIRKLSKEKENLPVSRAWYLPIFPVVNPNKPGKVRLVWDAAATVFGTSLNSALLKGPDQMCSLFSILLQFRKHRVGLTGDIREMFHQIQIRETDRSCQRFFWRDNTGEIIVYEMCVMTFGACCSPSSAQYVKNINAERFSRKYADAVNAIVQQHYVDDMLVSVDSEETAIRLAQEVTYVHAQGGFEIRNWVSNSTAVITVLNQPKANAKSLDLSTEICTEKVLGLWWCTESDSFTYRVGWDRYEETLLKGLRRPTKREVLRVLMTIFDPLGLIAHFLIFLKILLQEIWRSGVQWDDTINDVLFDKWRSWLRVLPTVEKVRVSRCYFVQTSCEYQAEFHTFVDASENGFAGVSFLRFICGDQIKCTIVAAKTRVAPLKFQSIPRLELQAAVLGGRLAHTILACLSIQITRRIFWTDSRDVLCWINSDHRRFTQFVAHRVSEILDITEAEEWFNGPRFLWKTEEDWPQQPIRKSSTNEELRPNLVAHLSNQSPLICVTDFSKWQRLINVVGFVFRFPNNCRLKSKHQSTCTGPLYLEEKRAAEEHVVRQAQQDVFLDEITALRKQQLISRSSSLVKFSPWLDDRGVLRMRGRISNCVFITEEAKNPIILPRDHYVTTLIIMHYHHKFHHLNHDTVINEIRQKYSISRIRVCYAKARRACQRCKNARAVPSPPIMADLPTARLAAHSRPFTHVGIDYFGPMEVAIGRRVEKRWGMLATCMTIRAVHIEVVHSLSTDSCIMAIRNLIARRGVPRHVYCDRGTNFVGASNELTRVDKLLNKEAIIKEFLGYEIAWSFNPPASPHMGGSWERMIRSVKSNLMSLEIPRKPSDEVLRNALTEIEGSLNARPLTHVPIEDHAAPALTPNHILLGSSNGTKPLTFLDDSSVVVRQCWRTSQIIANQFWKRWLSEYLPEITRRTKWHSACVLPVKIGDVVIVVDPKLPRNCWPKGRVIATRPGKDGEVRSATVRTSGGVYERPVVKLAVLDVREGKFIELTKPLTDLLRKKPMRVQWNKAADEDFKAIKEQLISAPVMANSDFTLPFCDQTDASDTALTGVLTQ
ncbi:uncharacterized protein LOC129766440 [Toxorhynchites rutilus septentrionalis]|uniref:uncharacterized protein LOC129766440 n=1 Tax=Toxorhynchites rutilus septentrionalis TaxID=329112 RepID=UPI00247B1627|nr:uncharacterized protein LOC129766440 [Toxorhynchites rutilus septentrionalis]